MLYFWLPEGHLCPDIFFCLVGWTLFWVSFCGTRFLKKIICPQNFLKNSTVGPTFFFSFFAHTFPELLKKYLWKPITIFLTIGLGSLLLYTPSNPNLTYFLRKIYKNIILNYFLLFFNYFIKNIK